MKRISIVALLVLVLSFAVPAAASGPLALTVTVAGRAGAPVAGARVELMAPSLGTVASALSDASGRAAVTPSEAATTYWVRAWSPGHTTVDRPWVPAADGARLTVTPAPLSASITGIVADHLGLPVAGARVSAWHKDLGLITEALTDTRGAYTLNGLPAPGPYTLHVTAGGFRPYVTQQSLPVAGGKSRAADVTLVPNSGVVTGAVVESVDLDPLAGARVELLRKGWGLIAATTTADDGTFAFTAPPADAADYQVRIWMQDYYSLSQPFALAPGGRKEFTGTDRFNLLKTTYGVHSVDLEGTVTDDQGQPLDGARVTLYRAGEGAVTSVTSQAGGHFRLADAGIVSRTGYVLEASRDGYFTAAEAYPDSNAATVAQTLRLRPATAQLRGRVADTWGAPLAGVTVSAGDLRATTDANGFYQLDGLPAGPADSFLVRAFGTATRTVTAAEGPVATAGVRSRTLDLQGVAPAAVTGVVAGPDGAVAAGAAVELWHEGEATPAALARAGDDGSYSFTGLIPGDRYTVLAVPDTGRPSSLAPGEASVTPLFRAVAGATRQADLSLAGR